MQQINIKTIALAATGVFLLTSALILTTKKTKRVALTHFELTLRAIEQQHWPRVEALARAGMALRDGDFLDYQFILWKVDLSVVELPEFGEVSPNVTALFRGVDVNYVE